MNPNRLWAALFGSFAPFSLALRQQSGGFRTQNSSNIARPKVLRSFSAADFFQDNEAAADNTGVLSRQMRQYWEKSALKNRFGFDSPCPTAQNNYDQNAKRFPKSLIVNRSSLIVHRSSNHLPLPGPPGPPGIMDCGMEFTVCPLMMMVPPV